MLRAVQNLAPGFMYYGAVTWANLPSASTYSGYIVRVTDVGIAPGSRWVSDGTGWRPDGLIVLARSAVAVSGAADTNENTLATINIPASAMGLNSVARVTTVWTVTNNANAKNARVRFSGGAGTQYMNVNIASAAAQPYMTMIANRGSASSQVGMNGGGNVNSWSSTSSAIVTSSVDTTAATTILITAQKATAGDTMTLESYIVELLP